MDSILVVNAGSSSVKFQVFGIGQGGGLDRAIKGQIDGIGSRPKLRANASDGRLLIDKTYAVDDVPDVPSAIGVAGAWLSEQQDLALVAVGHRVVHGGPEYDRPLRLTPEILDHLERYVALAPLHQPNNLAPIRTLMTRRPDLPQVACFDTAFHRGHDAVVDHYAIPQRFYDEGVRRYGFHGLSYEFIATRLKEVAPRIADGRVIVAHLGSGASMCALAQGRSIESTMGFTALDGLPMGTRTGQIDPGVILYFMTEKAMSPAAVQDLLYTGCGFKGLSGISNDMRELLNDPSPSAALAIDYFAYRVGLHAGMLAAALGGLDAFVFTAGIGENSPDIRARIATKLGWLGVALDADANAKRAATISTSASRIPVYVIPTDEELMIARHTLSVLTAEKGGRAFERAAS